MSESLGVARAPKNPGSNRVTLCLLSSVSQGGFVLTSLELGWGPGAGRGTWGVNRGQSPPLTSGEILPTILFLSLGLSPLSCDNGTRPLSSWWMECDLGT